jgi:tetratricopeptide (TPR) repeat protein
LKFRQAQTSPPFLTFGERSKMKTALVLLALFLLAAGCQEQPSQGNLENGNVPFKQAENDRVRGDGNNAIANYTEAIRCYAAAGDPMLSSAYFGRGLTYWRMGDRAAALRDFDEAERLGFPVGRRPYQQAPPIR